MLRGLDPDAWKVRDATTFRKQIGHLWKGLEVAMNAAALPISFMFYACSKIMTCMIEVPDSGMTFTPVLDTVSEAAQGKFKAKVRYRPQGRVASKRYTNPSDAQRAKVLLPRSLLAAAGVPPVQRRRRLVALQSQGDTLGGNTKQLLAAPCKALVCGSGGAIMQYRTEKLYPRFPLESLL